MKYLIVYAHPQTRGFNQEILKQVKLELESREAEYEVLDLYELNYNPVLSAEEHYTVDNSVVSDYTMQLQEKIANARKLVFIYPVWWANMPAILKGFIDRVITPGFAFKYSHGRPVGLLKDKKAIVFLTSGGPKLFYLIWGNRPAKSIKKDVLYFCGIKTKICQIFEAKNLTEKRKLEIVKKVRQYL